jgi:hypothetical protein
MRPAPSAVRLAALGLVWIICFGLAIGVFADVVHRGILGADSHAYWLTGHEPHIYAHPPESRDAYLYSPVFAQIIWPLTQLSWPVFCALWMVAESAAFVWLLAPLGWAWAPPLLALAALEVSQGNIWPFLGIAAVLGFRRPECWSFAILTKITLALGPVWFVVRREWLSVVRAVWPAILLAGISFAATPHQWTDWVHFLRHNGSNGGGLLIARIAVGVLLAVVAAMSGRAWLLLLAMVIAAPVLHGVGFLSLLAALPRIEPGFREHVHQRDATSKIVADP